MTADVTVERVRYLRCAWCGTAMEPTRLLCPVCGATELHEQASRGLGVVAGVRERTRQDVAPFRLHQSCLVMMDEEFTVVATLARDQYAVVRPGARVRVREGGPCAGAEFRLI